MKKFSSIQKNFLLFLGRESIEYYMDTKRYLSLSQVKNSAAHELVTQQKIPVFILLRSQQKGEVYVRGESGVLDPDLPLGDLIIQVSVHAAFFDPKTPRLKPYELNEICIEYLFPEHEEKIEVSDIGREESVGIRARFRGREIHILPYQWNEFESAEQVRKYIELSLGAKGKLASEVEYSVFHCTHISEPFPTTSSLDSERRTRSRSNPFAQ